MSRNLFALGIVALFAGPPAQAAPAPLPLRAAMDAYEALEFERCVELLSGFEVSELQASPEALASAAVYRGLCAFNLAQATNAKRDFKKALLLRADTKLPPDVSPKAKELFQSAAEEAALERQLSPPPPTSPPAPLDAAILSPTTPLPRRASLRGPLILGGVGLAGGALASYLGAQAKAHERRANAATFASDADSAAGLARTSATAANVTWVAAGAVVITAAAWAVLNLYNN